MPASSAPPQLASPAPKVTPHLLNYRLRLIARYLILTLGSLIVIIPIYLAIVNSLLVPSQLAHQPPPFFPTNPQWHTYSDAWSSGHLGVYIRNSLIQTIIIVSLQIVTSVLAAFAFAFLEFPFKRTIFVIFLSTLMIPFEVTVTQNLSTISSLGWMNTFQGLTVPFLATGFGVFLLRQAFLSLPPELREAALLDGYGNVRFLTRVVLPLSRPVIAALAVFSFLGSWNQYLWPLLVSGNDNKIRTVQIGLKQLAATQLDQINVSLAGTVIAFLPLIILLIIFQKQLVRSLTAGSVK